MTGQGGIDPDGGTAFSLTPDGANWEENETPETAPVVDASGNIYGTTSDGGRYGYGVLFRIQTNGAYEVLHDFCKPTNCSDATTPDGLVSDGEGHIFGVAVQGGPNNGGAIFEYTP